MTTWICSGALRWGLAGAAFAAMAACTEETGQTWSAAFAAAPEADPTVGRSAPGGVTAPRQTAAVIADGRVALRAPNGFCVDASTISDTGVAGGSFAMLARCSRLSAQASPITLAGQSAAVITVTTRPWTGSETVITSQTLAATYPSDAVLDIRTDTPVAMIKASGRPAAPGLDDIHWRSAFVVNRQLVVLGLFASEGSRALGSSGANTLGQFARRTRSASLQLPSSDAEKPPQ
ncbi:MAG: hypothetical protein AAGF79_01895 [Pseudomonadota bacterium]